MRRITIDHSDEIQQLRDTATGRFVELDCVVGATIHHIERGESDELIMVLEGVEDDELAEG